MKEICVKLHYYIKQENFSKITDFSYVNYKFKIKINEEEKVIDLNYDKKIIYRKYRPYNLITTFFYSSVDDNVDVKDILVTPIFLDFYYSKTENYQFSKNETKYVRQNILDMSKKPNLWTHDGNDNLIQMDYIKK